MTPEGPEGVRPDLVVVVAGTGTEVGKTWVTARLAAAFRRDGLVVVARKPAQSFEREDAESETDAGVLSAATGEEPGAVCPRDRWYPTPLAPPMAADSLGRDPIALSDLLDEVHASWPTGRADVALVELAGGAFSPIAHDGDCIELALALRPDVVVLVADAGLGTISAVRPAAEALSAGAPTLVALNRFDPQVEVHRRNLAWLRDVDGWEVTETVDQLRVSVLRDG